MPLKKIYTTLFFLGVFFLGFNEFKGLSVLGEFQSEAAAFFFLAGFLVLLVSGRVSIPLKSTLFRILVVFLVWCIVTTLINLPTVIHNDFKSTTGINRFIRQYIALMLSAVVFFVFYWNVLINMSLKDIFFKIRKVMLWSFMVAAAYGFLEILVTIYGVYAVKPILDLFSYLPFLEVSLHIARISSVTFEAPSLGTYLITISAWMFSYILTGTKVWRFIPAIIVLILMYYSGSRTALVIVSLQLVIFMIFMLRLAQYRKYVIYGSGVLAFAVMAVISVNGPKLVKNLESLNFVDNFKSTVSNQSRFGIQYASLQVFAQHPVVGVGYGQQTYHARYEYPGWATHGNWEFKLLYNNPKESAFPAGYNLFTRLLAETGLIGTLLYIAFLYFVIARSRVLLRITQGHEQVLALILLISFVGLTLNWFQTDSFRLFGFWICLAILIRFSIPIKTAALNDE